MDISSVNVSQPAPTSVSTPTQETREENRDVIKAVKALNAAEKFGKDNELNFLMDRDSRKLLVRVVDRETKEVIRQLPPEHALRMAEEMELNL